LKKKLIYYLFKIKKPFVGYEYAIFQFLKHDGYAQRLCNQIHNFGSLKKITKIQLTLKTKPT
jgi:hypothetical protein